MMHLAFSILLCVLAASAQAAPLPRLLSETGLYEAGSTTRVRSSHLAFAPQYPLWSDGARKRRWLALPPGTAIDARRPDAWDFPPGTRLWKEFAYTQPVETRYIERLRDGSWRYATYIWRADGSDAELAPEEGVPALSREDLPGGHYAVPARADCRTCHDSAPVPVLGASALQLSPLRDTLAPHADDADGLPDLRQLAARGLLRNLPPGLLQTPPRIAASSPVERAALGYLHGNCGHCHSDPAAGGRPVPIALQLAQRVSDAAASREAVLRSLIDVPARFRAAGTPASPRVAASHADASLLVLRMASRDPRLQMPPLGTQQVDALALHLIQQWINHVLNHEKED